jgi:hypothetical protein
MKGAKQPVSAEEWTLVFLGDVRDELREATGKFGPLNSHHEAYAVILEELDEYWQAVKDKTIRPDSVKIYQELVQVAAMVTRAVLDCVIHVGKST